jgi:hypothetical protein
MARGVVALSLVFGVAMACGTRTGLLPGEQQEPSSGGVGSGGDLSVGGRMQQSVAGCTHHVAEDGRACESWACVGGYVRRADAQISCDESCQLDCGDTACPEIELSCGPGAHAGTQPGECCPSCVSDAPPCEHAQRPSPPPACPPPPCRRVRSAAAYPRLVTSEHMLNYAFGGRNARQSPFNGERRHRPRLGPGLE